MGLLYETDNNIVQIKHDFKIQKYCNIIDTQVTRCIKVCGTFLEN